ncbi:MAG: peptidase U62 [Actinobacteria bacterium 13_2_20CM_2_71_6]|nr:MAG: peptidase U62 [Actinobacteria bacterium 13_2_20CM_2_71_6]
MTTLTELDLAARVLEWVRVLGGPGTQAEALVERHALALTRFANSYIHQNVADSTTTVRLRLHRDGRTARGTTTLTVADALRDLVERTVAASRLCPPDPGWPGLAPPSTVDEPGTVDDDIIAASPADRAARVRAFVDASAGLPTAGFCRTTYATVAFVNSAGQVAQGATTEVAMNGIARTASADGAARRAGPRLSDVDGAVLGARAAAKALAGTDPVELPPGRYEVVLEPTAVGDILFALALYGFNGKAVNERRSFVVPGQAQFDESITLVDDPTAPGQVGLPFDVDGAPKRPLTLIRAGISEAVPHDRRTAAVAGTASNGRAIAGGSTWGAVPTNLTLLPASATPPDEVAGPAADSSALELVSGVRRGLLVTDHWYTRVLDPRTLVLTGLTRNGLWLIENGEITRPVRNLRFTQSYPQALAPGAVLGVGSYAAPGVADWDSAFFAAPALHLAGWNFTGGASG